jgi:murein DD-endopeptidase MepM/ murein hydrolase activator NlpD
MQNHDWTRRGFLKCMGATAASMAFAGCRRESVVQDAGEIPAIPFETVDMDIGEQADIALKDGTSAKVRILAVDETYDRVCRALRSADIHLEIDGNKVTIPCANYSLPTVSGRVKVDCQAVKAYMRNTNRDYWALENDVRLRLWPANWPLLPPDSFVYPLKQRWFATRTQMANEPTYVDGGEYVDRQRVYYHSHLDFGGAEGLVDVVSATDGVVESAGTQTRTGADKDEVQSRYDVVYIKDQRGWHYRYSHLYSIVEGLKPGDRVKKGQKIGVLGKEGGSGGWSHLHFGITCAQPNGKSGTQESYCFAWEAYLREYKPDVIAVARPHILARPGDEVTLDGSKSWSRKGKPQLTWTLSDGRKVRGATATISYDKMGTYSEILEARDADGNVSYDFCTVQIFDIARRKDKPPSIHSVYWPTYNIRPGRKITFKVRSFMHERIGETFDFGDGSEPVTLYSDGNADTWAKDGYAVAEYAYAKAGDYIVTATCQDSAGRTGTTHLHVKVDT